MEVLCKKTGILLLALLMTVISFNDAHAGKRKNRKKNQAPQEKTVEAVIEEKGISKEELEKLPAPFRAFIYSLTGATVEVLFTAAQTLHKDYNLEGYTQLWVLPLYAGGAMGIEKFSDKIKNLNPLIRSMIYMVAFFALEFTGGYVAKQLTGECPWTYTGSTAFAGGILNGFHAPVWASLGLFAEQYVKVVQSLFLPKSMIDKIKSYFKIPSFLNYWSK